jgi:hypothetical protein
MFDPNLLVKLASLGTSGICIFGIFCSGYLLLKNPAKLTKEHHHTLRYFMAACVAIAIISGASALAASWQDKTQLANSIAAVIQSKEAYILRNPSPELATHVKQLRFFVAKAGVELPSEQTRGR